MDKQPTIPMMIAKNMSAEADAIKEYLPLLDAFPPESKEAAQILEIIEDELAHSLVLSAMLVKGGGVGLAKDAKEAIKFLASKI